MLLAVECQVGKQYGKSAKEVDTIGSAIDAKMKPALSIVKGKTSAPFRKCDLSKIEAQFKSCTYSPLPGDMGIITSCEYCSLLTLLSLTLTVTEIHPVTYGQGQGYRFLGHQS